MEKKKIKRLVLNKGVIKRLDQSQLGNVAGGSQKTTTFQTTLCTAKSVCPCPTCATTA